MTTQQEEQSARQQQQQHDTNKRRDLEQLAQVLDLIDGYTGKGLPQTLAHIGRLLHAISWNKSDALNLRNDQGYRNRADNRSNEVNDKGARIDFEAFGHLIQAAADLSYFDLIMQLEPLFLADLQTLKRKILFVFAKQAQFVAEVLPERQALSQQYHPAPEALASRGGALYGFACFYHDQHALEEMLSFLEQIVQAKDLNLHTLPARFHLAYLFSRFGELAKEVSDCIKPEHNAKTAEPNITRFFFGKLGAYRQAIKNKPFRVHRGQHRLLEQMRFAIIEKHQDIRSLLQQLLSELKQFDLLKLDEYVDFNLDTRQNNVFERRHAQRLQALSVWLNLGTKDDLEEGLVSIDQELAWCQAEMTSIQAEVDRLRTVAQPTQQATPSGLSISPSKKVVQLYKLLGRASVRPYLDQTAEQLDTLLHISNQILPGELKGLSKMLKSCQHFLRQFESTLHKSVVDFTLADMLLYADRVAPQPTQRDALAACAMKQKKRIKQQQELLQRKAEQTDFLEAFRPLYQPAPREGVAPARESDTEVVRELENIVHVLGFLRLHREDALGPAKLMAIALKGQYSYGILEKVRNNPVVLKHLNALIDECMNHSSYLRSKMLLHDTANLDLTVVQNSLSHMIMPLIKDFEALHIVNSAGDRAVIDIIRALLRLGSNKRALEMLQDYLKVCERELHAPFQSYQAMVDCLGELDEHDQGMIDSMNFIQGRVSADRQQELIALANLRTDQISVTKLMMDCQLDLQDYPGALSSCERLLILIEPILAWNKLTNQLFPSRIIEEVQFELEQARLYALVYRSYVQGMMGNVERQQHCLADIRQYLSSNPGVALRCSSFVARTYIDMSLAVKTTPDLGYFLLDCAQIVKPHCPDPMLIDFNIHQRRFELAHYVNGAKQQQIRQAALAWVDYFRQNEQQFKADHGQGYLRYKFMVLLAQYATMDKSVRPTLDQIEPYVDDVVSRSQFYYYKLAGFLIEKNFKAFQAELEAFYQYSVRSNNLDRFCSYSLDLFDLPKKAPTQYAQCILGTIQARCVDYLDAKQRHRFNTFKAGYSQAKQRFFAVGSNGKKIGRNELCPCESGKKYKKCHG